LPIKREEEVPVCDDTGTGENLEKHAKKLLPAEQHFLTTGICILISRKVLWNEGHLSTTACDWTVTFTLDTDNKGYTRNRKKSDKSHNKFHNQGQIHNIDDYRNFLETRGIIGYA